MKEKNGFTLVEMIGIIVLLAVIMLVVAPSMITTLQNSNSNRWTSFKDNVKMAAENYIVNHKLTSSSSVDINLGTLLEENYIEEIPSIPSDDPFAEDGEELTSDAYIKATKTTSGYTYLLCKNSSTCQDIGS